MKIQKLNWAGIKLECGNKTVLIDAVENFKPYFPVLGKPKKELIAFSDTVKADYILITHLHLDHFDSSVIEKCLKETGKIISYKKLESAISKLNKPTVYLDVDEQYEEDGIIFKAVFSLDGIGEEQTAWIVAYQGTKIFHGGDSIWHNQFWKLGKANQDIDYAFLPINGVVVNFQMIGLQYSTVPASLTPEQAFNAAKLLNAKALVPIHYGLFATDFYKPIETSQTELEELSEKIQQPFKVLNDGECLV